MPLPANAAHPLRMTDPLAGQLLASLRERVVRGELVPGTRLSEQEIAAAYGLSRQPVREAFIRLADEELLEIRPQRGTFVRKIRVAEVESSRFVREAVEADIVRLAAARATGADAAELRLAVARQEEAGDCDAATFMALDERFHRTIAEIAGRSDAWDYLEPLKMHMDRVRYLTAAEFPVSRLVGEHRAIAEAVAARDPDAAEIAVRRHLKGVLDDLPLIVEAQPGFFETGPLVKSPATQTRGRTR